MSPTPARASHSKGARQPTFDWRPYALVTVVLLAVLAFLLVRGGYLGSALPNLPGSGAGGRGLPVGAAAPSIPLQSTNGTSLSLDQLRGSKVVVYFYESSG